MTMLENLFRYVCAGVRASAVGTALFAAGCDYLLPDSADSTNAPSPVVQDAGARDGIGDRAGAPLFDSSSGSSSSGSLDKKVEKYFVEERVERSGMVLGTDAEAEREPNEKGTEYVNSIFVEGKQSAIAVAEQASARIKSKILDFYEMILPVTTTEQRDAIRRSLHEQGIETFTSPIFELNEHLDVERATRDGTNIWAYRRIQLPEALHALGRDDFTNGPAVAVIDSGVSSRSLNIVDGYDYADNDPDYSRSSLCLNSNHGTMVAGLIGAPQSGTGLNGVAPNIPLYVYKVQDFHLLCQFTDMISFPAIISSLVDVSSRPDIGVVNLSFTLDDNALDNALLRWAVSRVINSGKLVVAAAGNSNETADHLSAVFPGIVGVGGTQLSAGGTEERYFIDVQHGSNYWERGGNWLAAPGRNVAITPQDYITGTSFSAPLVSGLAALLRYHGLSAEDAYQTMRSSADQLWVSYPDNSQALWHRINAYRAVCSVIPCGEQADGVVDAPPENAGNADAGRNNGHDAGAERDAGIPEEDARRIGEGEGEGAQGGEGEGGGIGGEGEGEGERQLLLREFYALAAAENSIELFEIAARPDCTIERRVQLTQDGTPKSNLRSHPQGTLYTTNDTLILYTGEETHSLAHFRNLLARECFEASSHGEVVYAGSAMSDGRMYIVSPGEEPRLLVDTSFINGNIEQDPIRCPEPFWRPDGREIGIYVPALVNKLVFISPEEGAVPVEYRRPVHSKPTWLNNAALSFVRNSFIQQDDFGIAQILSVYTLNRSPFEENLIARMDFEENATDFQLYIAPSVFPAFFAFSYQSNNNFGFPITTFVEDSRMNTLEHTSLSPRNSGNSLSSDGRFFLYNGVNRFLSAEDVNDLRRRRRIEGHGIYLYDRQTQQHCLLMRNGTEAVWNERLE